MEGACCPIKLAVVAKALGKTVYRTTLGHARLTQHPTVVMRPLDFEDRSRVFKFWFTWGQFRDRMFLGRSEHQPSDFFGRRVREVRDRPTDLPGRPGSPTGRLHND